MLPNFVILGAQKSATTFIQNCLAEHPEVYMPPGETTFFESPDYEQQSISALEMIFEGRKEKRVGIKRPNYIGKPEVPDRIETHLFDAKLIAILRNPIERAVSAYHHQINYGFIPSLPVEKGMRLLLDGAYIEKYKRAQEIIEFGFYHKYLVKYKYFFDRNQILTLLYNDILSLKLKSVQKIYSYLDIASSYVPQNLESKPQEVLYNIHRLKFASMRNPFIYKYNSDRTRLYRIEGKRVGKVLASLITIIDKKLLSLLFSNKKPNLSIELKNRLFEIYEDDIEKLQHYIHRDLSHWKP